MQKFNGKYVLFVLLVVIYDLFSKI